MSGQRDLPKKCPFLVDYAYNVDFAATLYGPKETTPSSGGAYLDGVWSLYDHFPVVPNQFRYYSDDPFVSSNRTLQFVGFYLAGYVLPWLEYPWSHDSGTVTADSYYGPAKAFITMSGGNRVQGANLSQLLVAPTITTGSATSIRALTQVDTNAYDFLWRVDGVDVANNDAILGYTFSTPGNHDVIAFASYLTGVDTVRATVYAAFVVNIAGPTVVDPNAGLARWDANIPGGFPPYSYQWYFDGVPVTTASFYEQGFGPSELHTLSLTASDSHGFSASTSLNIQTTAGGTCLQQPCP